ncbi:hypothetical protein MN608_10956 [Microdochium nivale]|nr:hypothetical protein MN608_10956 [Microdochium nivale]
MSDDSGQPTGQTGKFRTLPAFGPGSKTFAELYAFSRGEIYEFLADVKEFPEQFGLGDKASPSGLGPGDAGKARWRPLSNKMRREAINELMNCLVSLCIPEDWVEGANYRDPYPYQHILRKEGLKWSTQNPMDLQVWKCWVFPGPLQYGTVHAISRKQFYWSPLDMLGLFLSLVLLVPAEATTKNFFFPAACVYAKWCTKIAGYAAGGTGYNPAVVQCTVRHVSATERVMSLGASRGGHKTGESWKDWERKVKRARFDLFATDGRVGNYMEFESPNRLTFETEIGNCGESYPFLNLLIRGPHNGSGVAHGLAIKLEIVTDDKFDNEVLWEKTGEKGLLRIRPCENCVWVLQSLYGIKGEKPVGWQPSAY